MDLSTQTVWRRHDDILTRRTSRSVLVLTAGSGEPLLLEGATVFVWDELTRPATDAELIAAIASRLAVESDAVRAEVVAAREMLSRHGALVGSDD